MSRIRRMSGQTELFTSNETHAARIPDLVEARSTLPYDSITDISKFSVLKNKERMFIGKLPQLLSNIITPIRDNIAVCFDTTDMWAQQISQSQQFSTRVNI